MKTKNLILALSLGLAASASAQTFNWSGTNTFTDSQFTYFDSFGNPLATGDPTGPPDDFIRPPLAPGVPVFSIGYFNTGFTPTLANIDSWNTNFVSLGSDNLEPAIPWSFGGTDSVVNTGSNGKNPYLWIYDSLGQVGAVGGQVFLGTWNDQTYLPIGSIDPSPTFDFANMTNVLAGQADFTFWSQAAGGVNQLVGAIDGTRNLVLDNPLTDNNFEGQLARIAPVVVPEPSGALLGGLSLLGLLLRRRRA